jgi:P27 family predicted phage terminase small subunit
MTRGRKPKPTRLKLLAGNPGKRPLNMNEPKPLQRIPQCPEHLDREAKRARRRITKQLFPIGLLTIVDRDALAVYCQAWSRWVLAEEHLKKFGPVVMSKDKQWPMLSPFLIVANQAIKQMQHFLTQFGMTPASRSILSVSVRDPEIDALEKFINEAPTD